MTRSMAYAGALALGLATACAPTAAPSASGTRSTADAIALRATTALSLAELAYNSAEAGAAAAVRSGAMTPVQNAAIGAAIDRARAYRNDARALVAAGGDASASIESLDATLVDIDTLSHPAAH